MSGSPTATEFLLASLRRARRAAACAAVGLALMAGPALVRADAGPGHMPRVELGVGVHLIHAELAANDADRMLGLMFRKELGPNDGMLFDFEEAAQHCMWMRNTLIPLSVAFLDASGAVINVEEMRAQTDDSHCAMRPARYALEMGANWFGQHGVRPGTVIAGVAKPARH
jgi:uncharacterized membrane protein (UPF0127 family)